MPRLREPISEEAKKQKRREQKRLSMQRARAKMSDAALEKRRNDDKMRYKKKKEQGLIKTIKDYTPRQQRQIRKIWREKAVKAREKKKNMRIALEFMEKETPPSSPSLPRSQVRRVLRLRNTRRLRIENYTLKDKIESLNNQVSKFRMRLCRTSKRLKHALSQIPVNLQKKKQKVKKDIKKAIHDFLLQDEQSRLTSGKKEKITRKKVQKQIRLLNDSLLNIHKVFVKKTGMDITYETFRRHRPFWVLFPKVCSRNTCLCALHTNNDYMVRALYNAKIIPYKSATELIKATCCNGSLNAHCLEQKCPNCKGKTIECNDYNDNDTILYEKWVTKSVIVVIKGQTKSCRKTVKEMVRTTKKDLIETLSSNLPNFKKHVGNMLHQIKTIQELKQNLCPEHGLLHVDFSENYNCKYSDEVQAAHFGGSKGQISLHTSVYYSANEDPPENFLKTTSFCTASENLRHDPVMICVHVEALLNRIRELSPNLKHLHILSDGPLTQYRNKTMFHLIARYISQKFSIQTLTWHYSEKGHGKGAPDGVGGCVKRICDNFVARGNDIPDLSAFMSCLKENCKGIEVYEIDEALVPEIQQMADTSTTRPFKGTLDIHQITWSKAEPGLVHARRLSCLYCAAHTKCHHYEMGQIHIQSANAMASSSRVATCLNIDELLNSSSDGSEIENVSPNHPISQNTSSAPTEPNSPGLSDRLTPDIFPDIQNSRPVKRPGPSFDSDEDSVLSMGFSSNKQCPDLLNADDSESMELPRTITTQAVIEHFFSDNDSSN